MREVRHLHERVGAEEAAQGRVVQPGVHVHQAEPGQVLVAGVAPPEEQQGLASGRVGYVRGGVAQPPPGIVAELLLQRSVRVRDMGDATQVVPQDVIDLPDAVLLDECRRRGVGIAAAPPNYVLASSFSMNTKAVLGIARRIQLAQ